MTWENYGLYKKIKKKVRSIFWFNLFLIASCVYVVYKYKKYEILYVAGTGLVNLYLSLK